MVPLIILLFTFVIVIVIRRLVGVGFGFASAGRVAMAVMLVFTGVSHFLYTRGMAMMIPAAIPYRTGLVYITGLLEVLLAVLMLLPVSRKIAAWITILFFLCVLPANVYAAINHIDHRDASYSGPGLSYLWFRTPLQLFFIGWVYFSAIRKVSPGFRHSS